eukprot:1158468-Pelagomonas_calceolata.AAC.5
MPAEPEKNREEELYDRQKGSCLVGHFKQGSDPAAYITICPFLPFFSRCQAEASEHMRAVRDDKG